MADSAVLPLWYLCRGTAAQVKVALSGEGGDEVLGGYARYFWGPIVEDLRPVLQRHASKVLGMTTLLPSRSLGIFNVARRAAKLVESAPLEAPSRYLSWFDLFSEDERRSLAGVGRDGAAARLRVAVRRRPLARSGSRADPAIRRFSDDAARQPAGEGRQAVDGSQPGGSRAVSSRSLVEFGLGLPRGEKIGPLRNKTLMRRLLRTGAGDASRAQTEARLRDSGGPMVSRGCRR